MADKKKNKNLTLFFVLLSVALAAIFIFVKESREEDLPEELKQELSSKLDSSVTFIAGEYEKQKLFKLYMCREDHSKCVSSAFSTFTSVVTLLAMHDVNNEIFESIIGRETERILNCQNEHLLWDFYCKKSSDEEFYFPDLDSTSMASWFLSLKNIGHHLDKIRAQIRKTQFHNGALLTFLRDFQPPQPLAMDRDPVANANALVLLGEEIPSVCEYVNSNFDKSMYYTDDVVVFYMLSKVYDRGVKCVKPALNRLYTRIVQSKLLDTNDSPMHHAMFVTAVMKSGDVERKVLNRAVKLLLENRKELPFKEYFFRTGLNKDMDFYYSPAFSAAVYAEALANIKSYYGFAF